MAGNAESSLQDTATQRISACDGSPGFGFNPYQGRGAPEIDLLEGMFGLDSQPYTFLGNQPYQSEQPEPDQSETSTTIKSSFQCAPGRTIDPKI